MFFASRNYRLRRQDREGYVLIMTLVLIVLAALTQAGLARRSLQLATEAVEAQNELQHRWGAISCRRLLLDNAADRFLVIEELHRTQEKPWPAPSNVSLGTVTLGHLQFTLRLTDEDARLNLNSMRHRLPGRFDQLVSLLTGNIIPVSLRPDLSEEAVQTKRWYKSWGQVFALSQILPERGWESLLMATANMTCWGTGKVNVHRTQDVILEAIVAQVTDLQTAREFLEARQESPELDLDNLLNGLALRRSQLATLRAWLTDESKCFSLWIEIADRQRKWYHLYITGDRSASADSPYLAFHW